ncbi:50S ribosomal protein L23 [Candidatus Saccharibacteria bacterium]|nr:50S ribosomal protein L23 [Candidatus Saccharibacteria bacterium]
MVAKKTEEISQNQNTLAPRATEKTYMEQTKRTYVFPVKRGMGKQEIAELVEKEFSVTVTDVRTLIRNGKKTKYSKGKHAYPGITHRQDKKFAYVTLKEGDSIKVFEEPEEEKKDNKVSAKDAKAEKKAEKTAKADKNAGKENA